MSNKDNELYEEEFEDVEPIDGPDFLPDSQDMTDPDAPEKRDWLTNKEADFIEGSD